MHYTSNGIHLRRSARSRVGFSVIFRQTSSRRSERINCTSAPTLSLQSTVHTLKSFESRPSSERCKRNIASSAVSPYRRIVSPSFYCVSRRTGGRMEWLTCTGSSLSLHQSSYRGVSPDSSFCPSHMVGIFIAHLCRNSNCSLESGPLLRCVPSSYKSAKITYRNVP